MQFDECLSKKLDKTIIIFSTERQKQYFVQKQLQNTLYCGVINIELKKEGGSYGEFILTGNHIDKLLVTTCRCGAGSGI